ncbi:hypothetical protein UA32_12615 [Photobacterium angustum]|uniref:Uncharacterized protein n=1 Tax=Photobacterium angustum TaxID=661 RepID=A0ABX5H286_PHOAN|nr:hypothetical protein [Photobacterium angustum]KJG37788.1 hypothetical protein UA32_12615 [Photobacterium angustum]PSX07058.1 hypothetical protein C0W27_15935 [Photobacterium angustum]
MLIKLKRASDNDNIVEWACFDMYSRGAVRGLSGIITVKCEFEPHQIESLSFIKIMQINDHLRRSIGVPGRVNISFSDVEQANYFMSQKMDVHRDLISPRVNVISKYNDWEQTNFHHNNEIDDTELKDILFKSPYVGASITINTDLLIEINSKLNKRNVHATSIIRLIDNNLRRQVNLTDVDREGIYYMQLRSIGITLKMQIDAVKNVSCALSIV